MEAVLGVFRPIVMCCSPQDSVSMQKIGIIERRHLRDSGDSRLQPHHVNSANDRTKVGEDAIRRRSAGDNSHIEACRFNVQQASM